MIEFATVTVPPAPSTPPPTPDAEFAVIVTCVSVVPMARWSIPPADAGLARSRLRAAARSAVGSGRAAAGGAVRDEVEFEIVMSVVESIAPPEPPAPP